MDDTMHQLSLPVRAHITPRADGHHQIQLHVAGRLSLVLDYDPQANTLTEVASVDFRPVDPMDALETKRSPMDDHA